MQRGTCEVILKGGGECEALGSNPSIKREDEPKKKKGKGENDEGDEPNQGTLCAYMKMSRLRLPAQLLYTNKHVKK